MTRTLTRCAMLGGCLAVLVLGGCGVDATQSRAAGAVALEFALAASDDPQKACELLAPETEDEVSDGADCAGALAEAGVPSASAGDRPRHTEVWGTNALVEVGTDTLFLARFRDGWRVTAAGCRPQGPDRPYDCSVKGS